MEDKKCFIYIDGKCRGTCTICNVTGTKNQVTYHLIPDQDIKVGGKTYKENHLEAIESDNICVKLKRLRCSED